MIPLLERAEDFKAVSFAGIIISSDILILGLMARSIALQILNMPIDGNWSLQKFIQESWMSGVPRLCSGIQPCPLPHRPRRAHSFTSNHIIRGQEGIPTSPETCFLSQLKDFTLASYHCSHYLGHQKLTKLADRIRID